ncbi:MAG: hypothetical protein AAGE52_41975 [Myxococcota bacterium]
MINSLKVSFSEDRRLRARIDPPLQALASYLEQDIQFSAEGAEQILTACANVLRTGDEWEGSGNAFTVTSGTTSVRIECDYATGPGSSCVLTREDFVTAVQAWLDAIYRRMSEKYAQSLEG